MFVSGTRARERAGDEAGDHRRVDVLNKFFIFLSPHTSCIIRPNTVVYIKTLNASSYLMRATCPHKHPVSDYDLLPKHNHDLNLL